MTLLFLKRWVSVMNIECKHTHNNKRNEEHTLSFDSAAEPL